jgi:hypothetical protein
MVLCVVGLSAMWMQVRCIDAAREAARLAARGDDGDAAQAAHDIAPLGAHLDLRNDGGFVVATVSTNAMLLPGFTIRAEATAARELGAG